MQKNVNVVEKNCIKAQEYLTMKGKLAFYWIIMLVTMTTPIPLHMEDKNDMFTVRGEDYDFFVRRIILVFHENKAFLSILSSPSHRCMYKGVKDGIFEPCMGPVCGSLSNFTYILKDEVGIAIETV